LGFAACAAIVRVVVACGSDDEDNPPSPSPDAALADASTTSDAGDGSSDATSERVAPTPGGVIYLFSQVIEEDAGPRGYANIQASFSRPLPPSDASAPAPVTTCTSKVEGACSAFACPPSEGGTTVPVVDAGPLPNAGRIEVTGAQLGDAGVINVLGTGRYDSVNLNNAVFAGGEEIRFAWEGQPSLDLGPPKGELLVRAPLSPTMTSPFLDGVQIPRTADFNLTWTNPAGQTPGALLTVLLFRAGGPGTAQVVCNFDVLSGAGAVPKSMLELIPAGAGRYQITIEASAALTVPGFRMAANVSTTSKSNRGISGVGVTFE